MSLYLDVSAVEGSTIFIHGEVIDENGDLVLPNDDMLWTLKDRNNNVVNNRSNVSIVVSSTFTIALTGDDLPYRDGGYLNVIFECTYDSTYGDDMNLQEEIRVSVRNLEGVSS